MAWPLRPIESLSGLAAVSRCHDRRPPVGKWAVRHSKIQVESHYYGPRVNGRLFKDAVSPL